LGKEIFYMRCCNLAAFHSGAKKSNRFNFQIRYNFKNLEFVFLVYFFLNTFPFQLLNPGFH